MRKRNFQAPRMFSFLINKPSNFESPFKTIKKRTDYEKNSIHGSSGQLSDCL